MSPQKFGNYIYLGNGLVGHIQDGLLKCTAVARVPLFMSQFHELLYSSFFNNVSIGALVVWLG